MLTCVQFVTAPMYRTSTIVEDDRPIASGEQNAKRDTASPPTEANIPVEGQSIVDAIHEYNTSKMVIDLRKLMK